MAMYRTAGKALQLEDSEQGGTDFRMLDYPVKCHKMRI